MNSDTAETEQVSADRQSQEESRELKNVILVGVTGCGKSSTGQQLARLLGFGFIDLDRWIEQRAGKSCGEIVSEQGEDQFRKLETAVIGDLEGVRNQVVSTGGGAPLNDNNWQILNNVGVTVWLNTSPQEVSKRLVRSETEIKQRPLLADLLEKDLSSDEIERQLSNRIATILAARKQRYESSRVTVADRFATAEATAQLIQTTLKTEGFGHLLKNSSSRGGHHRNHRRSR